MAGSSGSSFHGAASNSQHNGASAAPAPPKRVIRAINDYTARSSHELSFAQGDFFHVVSDDGGEDWFDAANPMTGARGMVPADCFQVLGRNVRETAQQQQQGSLGRKTSRSTSVGAGSMSGQPSPTYSAQGQSVKQNQQSRSSSSQPAGLASSSSSMSSQQQLQRQQQQQAPAAAHKPQPLYGIVQYDFVAERADELDAKRGEPIIVIAQSNHEWFVAKPIGRLGGPGLIPVAFVEIQDMTTGKPVENVEELIRSAVVPKVEEWKKMTADYKSASIPLGRFDFASTPAATTQLSQQQAPSTQTPVSPTATYSSRGDQRYSDQQPGSHTQSTTDPARHQSGQYDVNDEGDTRRYSYSRERRQFGLVTAASVESFHHEEGSYWFHLRAFFSTGASLVLYRLYQDFYDFQIALMDEFPVEAGRIPPGPGQEPERILPMMPGPTDYEDDIVCAQRVHDLSLYLGDLCALPERIRGSGLMYEFLVPRAGDVEVAKGNGQGDRPGGGAAGHGGHGHGHGHGASIDGRYGEVVEYLDQMDGGRAARVSNGNSAANHLEDGMARLSMNGAGGSSVRNSYTNSQQTQPRTESRQSRTSSTGFGARSGECNLEVSQERALIEALPLASVSAGP